MKSILIQGLEEDRATEIRADFLSALLLRKRIVEVLNGKIESKRTSVSRDYDNPNWSNKVAHSFGYEEALKEVISILSEKEEK
jgi:hypothetical protein